MVALLERRRRLGQPAESAGRGAGREPDGGRSRRQRIDLSWMLTNVPYPATYRLG
jgi:hypothetical protein